MPRSRPPHQFAHRLAVAIARAVASFPLTTRKSSEAKCRLGAGREQSHDHYSTGPEAAITTHLYTQSGVSDMHQHGYNRTCRR